MKIFIYFIYGILMSITNVIPGISGGTVALVLNFYDKLMESITLNFKIIKKNLNFIIPLGSGLVIGVIIFSKIMKILLKAFPTQTFIAFAGVIVGSLPLIYAIAKKRKKISKINWFVFLVAIILMIILSFISIDKGDAIIKYQTFSIEAMIMCFIAMSIATATMIIPGISGSLMLLIMGMYGTIYISAIGNLYFPLLIPTAFGGLFGLFAGAKLISYLLKRFEQLTYMAILGLLAGSLIELFKKSNILTADFIVIFSSIICFVFSFLIVYLFSLKEIKKIKE